ncbi:type I-U CRISPR-associated protein Cas7 [Streptomyces sp. NPDC047985]|uniref:type I-G CRISPR-associated protein Cas7 n=1 Tax=unclassified Streptomyces TaxID=2593676 RepID=UPI00342C2C00
MLLDQRQSQANRCEQALLNAVHRHDLFNPHPELTTEAEGMPVRITSMKAPHRSATPTSATRRTATVRRSTRRSPAPRCGGVGSLP